MSQLPDLSAERLRASIEPKSDQLNYDDFVGGPRVYKIAGVSAGSSDQPVNVRLEGERRYFRPCKTMRRVMIALFGDDGREWVGRRIELAGDPDVMFGGVKVGGVRVSRMDIDAPRDILVTETRSKRRLYHVDPLPAAPATPAATSAPMLTFALPDGETQEFPRTATGAREWANALAVAIHKERAADNIAGAVAMWNASADTARDLLEKVKNDATKTALHALVEFAEGIAADEARRGD